MENKIYMPILKGKKGEFDAIKVLEENVQNVILPLIEVPGISWDYANERESTTTEKLVNTSVKNIINKLASKE